MIIDTIPCFQIARICLMSLANFPQSCASFSITNNPYQRRFNREALMGELPNPLEILDPVGCSSGRDDHEATMTGDVGGGADCKSKTWLAVLENALEPMPPKEGLGFVAASRRQQWVVVCWERGSWSTVDESLHGMVGH